MTLCDTGILVELVEARSSSKAQFYKRLLEEVEKPLLTTWPCITESMYFLGTRGNGWASQSLLAKALTSPLVTVFEIQPMDYPRLFTLMAQYEDRPMDLADASLVLAAEQTGKRKILTIDSDFLFYRIHGRESFDIVEV